LEGHTFSRVVTVPFPLVIPSGFAEARRVEPRAKPRGRNLLFPVPAIHESSGNSEIQIPPAPFRGGITIAPHVSAGSATDRDHARFARHHPRRIGLQPRQFDHPEQQDDPLREPSCECLCRGGRLVRPGRAKLGSIFQPCKRTSRLGNCVDWEGLDWAEHDFSRATKTL